MEYKIACVIVTYNRKALLKRCLDAVSAQTFIPKVVYITDNASTDGTKDFVKEWGYYNCKRNGIEYKYILNSKNEGGAGGFYLGMKTAFEADHYDGIWVMDDDGVPERHCLQVLQEHLDKNHFISPMVISEEDQNRMAFYDYSVDDFKKLMTNGIVYGKANPFNGVLFSRELIEKVGYPKKELFIWGDENNYVIRSNNKGYDILTVEGAIHQHPKDRQIRDKSYGNLVVVVSDKKWKLFCLLRNSIYNNCINESRAMKLRVFYRYVTNYLYYYCIKRKEYSKLILVLEASIRGIFANFNGMGKYMR